MPRLSVNSAVTYVHDDTNRKLIKLNYAFQTPSSYPSINSVYSGPAPTHPLIPPSSTRLLNEESLCSSMRSANHPAARVPRPLEEPM